MAENEIPGEFQAQWAAATAAEDRFFDQNDVKALQQALNIWQELVQGGLPSAPEPFRWRVFDKLGLALFNLSRAVNDPAHLARAISVWEDVLANVSVEPPVRQAVLRHLGIGLYARFMLAKSPKDLDRAIELWQQAASGTSDSRQANPDMLNRLGNALRERYNQSGNTHDLNEAITCFQAAVDSAPQTTAAYPGYLLNLGICLRTRFEVGGAMRDLDSAIAVSKQAVAAMPEGYPYRASALNTLGNDLRQRYERTRELGDLLAAIDRYGEAVELAQADPQEQAMYLSNRGVAYTDLFNAADAAADLDQALRDHERAVSQTLATDPALPSRRAYLGNSLSERYKLHGDLEDIKEALAYWQAALTALSPSAPMRVTYLNNLGNGFCWRGERTNNPSDLDTASGYYQRAVNEGMDADRSTALASAQSWGQLALKQADWSGATKAYRKAIQILEQLLTVQNSPAAKQSWLRDAQLLYPRAAYALARHAEVEQALVILEFGRARLLAEALARQGENSAGLVPLSIDQLRSILTSAATPQTESIAVYLLVSPVGSAAFVIHARGIEPVWLDLSEQEFNQLLVTWEGKTPTGYLPAQMGLGAMASVLDTLLPTLGQRVIGPCATVLRRLWQTGPEYEHCIVLIPTGRFAGLPLHAASYGAGDEQRTLLDDYDVVYTPSARARAYTMSLSHARSGELPSLFGVGNPLPLPPAYPPLDFAALELDIVAHQFGASAMTVFEETATRQTVMEHIGTATYLHFSSHGVFDAGNPLESGLILSAGERLTLGDLLSSSKTYEARLAVLSACQTAISDFNQTPDEVLGLPAGFVQAGVAGVVGSLWGVNDLSTALLMIKFYAFHLKGNDATGEGPIHAAAALRKAQLWLCHVANAELGDVYQELKTKLSGAGKHADRYAALLQQQIRNAVIADSDARPFAHPYFWGAFAFYGA